LKLRALKPPILSHGQNIIILFIVVDEHKRLKITSHTVLVLLTFFIALIPITTHAGRISNFTGKVRAIFVPEAIATEEDPVTPQTIPLFKSMVIDTSTLQAEINENGDADVLSATAGPLRVSTEDIDYPTNDTISVYEVKKGDTLSTVAKLFNVSQNTIMWANDLKSKTISVGDTLIILPMTGIRHTIKKSDTVVSIAKKYKADADDIAKFNGIATDASLSIGEVILVPEGEIEIVAASKQKSGTTAKGRPAIYANSTPSGFLIRPVAGGRRSQGIHGNNGVDIAGPRGTPIMAAADGRIVIARGSGYNGGYGKMVVIIHDGGIQTLYAHLNGIYVASGMTVTQGQVIGEMGNTGRSTGPHLHFEVRGAKNPF
jgi:murein DD-endopeptidase MepM/ murein hydrolase activator NlpD